MSTRHDITSPTDTVCSKSPTFSRSEHIIYDQNSSEEELEVINSGQCLELSDTYGSPKRSITTFNENRKRSLVHSSDDEVRNLLENVPGPVVNFRTSPPLEALKPIEAFKFNGGSGFNLSHNRSKTPLILTGSESGLDGITFSCDSPVVMHTRFRNISPPAKLFHCDISPRRRPPRHLQQRLHRPHRPCLDFDKMQQVSFSSKRIFFYSLYC